jgi:hypothetical protein
MAKKDEVAELLEKNKTQGSPTDFLDQIVQEDKPLSERLAYESFQKLYDKKYLYMNSILNNEQRSAVIRMHIVQKMYIEPYVDEEDPERYMLQDIIDTLLSLTISGGGRGRNDCVDMVIGVRAFGQMLARNSQQQGKHFWQR